MADAQEMVRNKELNCVVELVGQVNGTEAILNEYTNADALVFPTHHEGFPRVLLEAMTKSCPVFTTMVGGIPGIMRTDDNCFEIPVKDPQGIATKIIQTMDNLTDWQSVSENGIITARQVLFERPQHHELFLRYV